MALTEVAIFLVVARALCLEAKSVADAINRYPGVIRYRRNGQDPGEEGPEEEDTPVNPVNRLTKKARSERRAPTEQIDHQS